MTSLHGYIYVRNHSSYDLNNACKLGKTSNIPDRDSQYATGEIKRGYFKPIFQIPFKQLSIIERLLQSEFTHFNIKFNAGTEFYDKQIITLIEPYLQKINIEYKKLNKKEINDLLRCNRLREIFNKINKKQLIDYLKQNIIYIPRIDQTEIINKAIEYYKLHDKGMLILSCGVGKTLISLWIIQKLQSNTILIGVPNKLLLKQWEKVINVIFKNIPYLIVDGKVDKIKIKEFFKQNNNRCILITTYASSYKIHKYTHKKDFIFDIKINDEVHHLTTNKFDSDEDDKTFINMLKIRSTKQLSVTATLKILENKDNEREEDIIVSNDNVKYFGEIIDRKCLLWAITENIICDYVIQTIITDEEQLENQLSTEIIDENDKRLFLSAYISLKSISDGFSHHLLIYSNNRENSHKLIEYINKFLEDDYFDLPDLYFSNYHSKMKSNEQQKIINKFEKSKYGIITCVYCLGEGWDFPLLDGVVFAENMTSNIRIVQSSLRASRKNLKEPNKITKIILPILNKGEWLEDNENQDLKKVREVIYQIGLEDETISQKIKVFKINIEHQTTLIKDKQNKQDVFGEYDEELTEKIRLKTTKRTSLMISYGKAKQIVSDNNIRSKEEYYELCEKDNRLTLEPDVDFKGKFINWIDYLNIDRIYYDLDLCKIKISEYLKTNKNIKKTEIDLLTVVKQLCKLDNKFPPCSLWVEYYNLKDLKEIIQFEYIKKRKLLE
jgi:predicted helicase